MKKALILFMTIGLFFAACKNDKNGKDKYSRDKDDYRKSETDTKDADKEKSTTDNNDAKTSTEEQPDYSVSGGWPQNERDAFITSCEREAVAAGQNKLVAQSYCECMLNKMENNYPDIKLAAKLSMEEIQQFGMKHRKKCLEEN